MAYNPFSLNNKTILVTGASSGIGQATAVECARMGAKVILTARNEKRLAETCHQLEGTGHRYIVADLLEGEDVQLLLEKVDELHGLVLCAGKGLTLPFPFCTRDKFDDIFEINLYSQLELLRLLYKKKIFLKAASVVTVASVGGTEIFSVGNAVYGASKAALESVMRFCAKEFAVRGIRVNTVSPGMVNTQLIQRGTLTEEQFQKDIERYPLKRYGEPSDIAHAIIYLLSDASSWVTGHSLVIDGGLSI